MKLKIEINEHLFSAVFEQAQSPITCTAFRDVMPFYGEIVHVRWSGEGMWIPLGDMDFKVGYEAATSYPAPGQILLYPKGKSETEILIAYGAVQFSSKAGILAGNHFATITSDLDKLKQIGIDTLWQGKKNITFSE